MLSSPTISPIISATISQTISPICSPIISATISQIVSTTISQITSQITSPAMLIVNQLSKYFDTERTRGLAPISLTLKRNEILVVRGPSGSGKTTLLRCIAGLERPDSGTVHFNGRDYTSLSAQKRNFGLMFQQPYLFENLTVFENIAFGIYRQPRPIQTQTVSDLLDLIQLPGYGSRNVRTLSGGEQQRVSLARTLAVEPDLIMFDEPFNSLDDEIRLKLIAEVKQILSLRQTPAIFVTHRSDEPQLLAARSLDLLP
jgi:ABC-type Fe3+/spermidine/putrescine transport system ATPase subunit